MIRFVLGWILSALIVYFIGSWAPFWAMMILIGFTSFFVGGNVGLAFISNGFGFATSWFILIQKIISDTDSALPNKIAELMSVKDSQQLIIITLLLAFILGGISGMTGSSFKKLFVNKSKGYGKPVY